jgi:hypothetical protein
VLRPRLAEDEAELRLDCAEISLVSIASGIGRTRSVLDLTP